MSKTVFNFRWLFMQTVYTLMILLGVSCWDPDDLWVSLIFIVIGAVLLIGFCVIFPYRYRFDPESVTLCYCFGMRTSILWREIKHIEIKHDFKMPWWDYYSIGYFKTKFPLHSEGEIVKNRKTTALIKKYYRKKID